MDSADRESDVQPLDVVFKCHDPLSLAQVEVEGPLSFQGQDVVILVKKFRLSEPQHNLLSKGLYFDSRHRQRSKNHNFNGTYKIITEK